jgi:SAM-dependent methyltransferase
MSSVSQGTPGSPVRAAEPRLDPPAETSPPSAEHYWDEVAEMTGANSFQVLWRRHSDAVNGALLARWLPSGRVDSLLKTDLFDEAVSEGLHPVLTARARRVVGIDLSTSIVETAALRHDDLEAVHADVRELPFAESEFDVAVSNSTLDHFEDPAEIAAALGELSRVLHPGGELIITLDNGANPLVALRNVLPFRLLHSLRVLPYYVGATCGPRRLRRMLDEAGFDVRETACILHTPRVVAVTIARAVERCSPSSQQRFLRWLGSFERMAGWPTSHLTGYFVAARAVKRATP